MDDKNRYRDECERESERAAFENWNKLAATHIITHLTNHKIFQHNLIIQCFVCSPNKKLQHHHHPCEISISLYICLSLHVIAHSLTHTRSISLGSCVLCIVCVPVCLSLTETFHVGFHRKAPSPAQVPQFTAIRVQIQRLIKFNVCQFQYVSDV